MNTRILDTFVQFKVRFPFFSEHWLGTNEMTSLKLSTWQEVSCSFDSNN